MNVNVKSEEKKENSTIELIIEVGHEDFEAAIDTVYKKSRGNIAIPGFRKGHAPRKIIENMYGGGVFFEDAINDVYPVAYSQAITDKNIDAVGYPNIEVIDAGENGLTFKAVVTVKPVAAVKNYKGLSAPKADIDITAEDLENELKPYINRATRMVDVDRKAKKGDTVNIDFDGFDNGVAFEGGKAEKFDLELGSDSFVPGFEEQIIGLKADDEKDIDITFPENYAPELAGKPVVFKVKVHTVKQAVAPTLDDEFAKDVSEFDTLDELKKDLADKLKKTREEQVAKDFENAIMEQLVDNTDVLVPDAMVDFQTDRVMQNYASRIQGSGISFEDYLQMMGSNVDDLRASTRANAAIQVKVGLALEAVAAAEKLTVTEEEVEAEIQKLATEHNMQPEQVKAAVSIADLKHDLLVDKASELVISSAKVGKAAEKKAEEKPQEAAAEKKPAAKKTAAAKTTAEKKPATKKTKA